MAWQGQPGGPFTASTRSSHVGVPGGRGTEVAHTALSLYRVVPVGYRVQIHGEENSPTWGQRLMALPVAQLGQAH